MSAGGDNPIRHKCPNDGCYLDTYPKINIFHDCLPRLISFTDYDNLWVTEVGRRFLNLEWKRQMPSANYFGTPGNDRTGSGQFRAYREMAATGYHTVFFAVGTPDTIGTESPIVLALRELFGKKLTAWKVFSRDKHPAGLNHLRRRIKLWADFAEQTEAELLAERERRRDREHGEWLRAYERGYMEVHREMPWPGHS